MQELFCDIAVFGAGPSGIVAALAAARNGSDVLLIEKSECLGGNLISGLPLLGFLDKQGQQVVGGIAQEIIDRLTEQNACLGHNRCALHNSVTIIDPEKTKILLFDMCREANVRLLLACAAVKTKTKDKNIECVFVNGKGHNYKIKAKLYIDSTGDGDVAYLSGAAMEKGQEKTGVLQPPSLLFMLTGFNEDEFFHYLEQHPKDLVASESMQVSKGYDLPYFRSHPGYVFLGLRDTLSRFAKLGISPLKRDTLIYIKTTHPGQICVNSTRILNYDGSQPEDITRGMAEAMLQIKEIHAFLKQYIPGFDRTYISHINTTIGARETRRFHGLKRLTIEDVISGSIPNDTIALGSYKIDIHSGTGNSTILKELEEPYGIPLKCLISSDYGNLMLNGRCISMDSSALASMRVMPTCMAIGQSSGVCAALAVQKDILPAQVPVSEVVQILQDEAAILMV
ncbi:FAD-dependent oxidoreductase [Blautia liquoris]|uniref:FAD-dependent oxidoreductase n=2 Tax=Blautia liquoris TaxID=2779518 RepID=A0A7M2RLL4_9FIRM|nr:FAD-dependent oxidoreductase [Blautia liquoris]